VRGMEKEEEEEEEEEDEEEEEEEEKNGRRGGVGAAEGCGADIAMTDRPVLPARR
jgi:hypothetical protein